MDKTNNSRAYYKSPFGLHAAYGVRARGIEWLKEPTDVNEILKSLPDDVFAEATEED